MIIIEDAMVNQKPILTKKIVAIKKLATEHLLKQLTFFPMKGLPPSRVLNIAFNCHKMYMEHNPDNIKITV